MNHFGTIIDYESNDPIRPATKDEILRSLESGAEGCFKDPYSGRTVWVDVTQSNVKTYEVDDFITPPESLKEFVAESYGIAKNENIIIRRTLDVVNGTAFYIAFQFPENTYTNWFDPDNFVPELGKKIGFCWVEE
jgi:hypothetical protein